jgi:hypothetical protein
MFLQLLTAQSPPLEKHGHSQFLGAQFTYPACCVGQCICVFGLLSQQVAAMSLFIFKRLSHGAFCAGGTHFQKGRNVNLTTHLLEVPRLRMSGAIRLLPLYAFNDRHNFTLLYFVNGVLDQIQGAGRFVWSTVNKY